MSQPDANSQERLKQYLESRREVIDSRPSQMKSDFIPPEEKKPEKNYDVLPVRLSYNIKTKFGRICDKLGKTPSTQARTLIEEFVEARSDLLE